MTHWKAPDGEMNRNIWVTLEKIASFYSICKVR